MLPSTSSAMVRPRRSAGKGSCFATTIKPTMMSVDEVHEIEVCIYLAHDAGTCTGCHFGNSLAGKSGRLSKALAPFSVANEGSCVSWQWVGVWWRTKLRGRNCKCDGFGGVFSSYRIALFVRGRHPAYHRAPIADDSVRTGEASKFGEICDERKGRDNDSTDGVMACDRY